MANVLASLKSRAASAEAKYQRLDIKVIDVIVSDRFDFVGEKKVIDADGNETGTEPLVIKKTGIAYVVEGDDAKQELFASVPTSSFRGNPLDYVGTNCTATFTPYTDKEGNEQWGMNHITMKANNAVALATRGAVFMLQN